ncbi:TBC domain-containing protein [Coccidioides immitis RS]|uniref:TBC domain-containing protein n=1 Tax=Coccidioides immitis (strain RS) TaxID=246410 RepID=A0A0E1RY19_COCIM|nr:TBC domain-containing protein [Coccidioides immitis RS]EAS34888.2 TBC domain-containing protein [Coccidioides immitis RS]
MAEPIVRPANSQKRSSSQTSTSSRRSQKAKTLRGKPPQRLSTCSSTQSTDLTSFPSLSPDRSPAGFYGEPAINHALSQALLLEDDTRTQGAERGRKATLAGLTTSLPQVAGRAALFSDSVPFQDVPGSLHLAGDDHIERLIARTGAIKLVRQFARDLALRDAEISALRLRADERERELKKMLREMEVSNQDIERRLYVLENPAGKQEADRGSDQKASSTEQRSHTVTIDHMMNQAMLDDVGGLILDATAYDKGKDDLQATIRPNRVDGDTRSRNSSLRSVKKPVVATRGWQDYIWGSRAPSRKTSGASSVISDTGERDDEPAIRVPQSRVPSGPGRRKALDSDLFLPPEADSTPTILTEPDNLKPGDGDDSSIRSKRSARSVTSWTVKLFAGNHQASKDGGTVRSRARSDTPDSLNRSSSPAMPPKAAGSAVAALKRINGGTGVQSLSGRSSAASSIRGSNKSAIITTTSSASRRNTVQTVALEQRSAKGDSTHLGPVEMDAILPMESRPPTLTHIYNDYNPGELLTDRFGFIYDQRRNRRQKEASSECIKQVNNKDVSGSQKGNQKSSEDAEGESTAANEWQDYLKVATKPTELLSHTPAAGLIIVVEPTKPRSSSVTIGKDGSLSVVHSSPQLSTLTSTVVETYGEFAGTPTESQALEPATSEQEPVRLLLQRLTDLHDSSQRERTVKWNEFMRKVRAERRKEGEAAAASAAQDRSNISLDMPEVAIADGEVVGISGLGNKGKVGRAKWREFRTLVLGGIPVAYRAKIWAECSGASAMRVPGYYEDLVKESSNHDADPSIIAQIDMDINRTLTDNVFFRKGPGVAKLKEVLLAYSRRNPEVGYCQGMNLIAGSLLLIMPTAEDAFWVLTSIIEKIFPPHYYDHGLVASRADQQVLRQYVAEILPKLSLHLDDLGIELEALTFQWFLSVFTDCLSAEALYRVWDVVLCLSAPAMYIPPTAPQPQKLSTADSSNGNALSAPGTLTNPTPTSTAPSVSENEVSNNTGGGSTFLFQVALALLKLNEQQLLSTCSTPAAIYTYINHQMTNHAISIDGLIEASDALRNVVRREDVLARRAAAMKAMIAAKPSPGSNSQRSVDGDDSTKVSDCGNV